MTFLLAKHLRSWSGIMFWSANFKKGATNSCHLLRKDWKWRSVGLLLYTTEVWDSRVHIGRYLCFCAQYPHEAWDSIYCHFQRCVPRISLWGMLRVIHPPEFNLGIYNWVILINGLGSLNSWDAIVASENNMVANYGLYNLWANP